MNGLFKHILLFILLQSGSWTFASPEDAFNTFISFKGKWNIQSEGKPLSIKMIYDDGSKSSVVTEYFGKELSVIYRDGKDLLMTHFCNSGNQPRLKFQERSRPGFLEFVLFDVTNLKNPDAPHVQKIIYKIINNKRLELELVWKKGNSEESEKYLLTKI